MMTLKTKVILHLKSSLILNTKLKTRANNIIITKIFRN